MNDIINLSNGVPVVATNIIATEFGRRHDNVMQNIRSLIISNHLGLLDFKESSYLNKQNKEQPCYELTERGFLIAMPFIGGNKAKQGQVKLVDAFIQFRDREKNYKNLEHTLEKLQNIVSTARKASDEDSSDVARRLRKRQDDLPILKKAEKTVMELSQIPLDLIGGSLRLEG